MKITIESTERMVNVASRTGGPGVPARVWQGVTESGVPVVVCLTRIAVPEGQDQSQFQRELQEHAAPSADAVQAFPLRMLI